MKGGVGKTTLAVNCGYTLTKEFGKKVLIIDVDPQMNTSQYTLKQAQVREILSHPEKTIYGIIAQNSLPEVLADEVPEQDEPFNGIFHIQNNFDVIPSHLSIMDLNLDVSPFDLNHFIENDLQSLYDTIILDLPPTISSYTRIGLLASSHYVVPMTTDYLSFFGLPLLQNYIQRISRNFGKEITFSGIILNKVHPNQIIYQDVKSQLMRNPDWSSKLFTKELRDTTVISRAFSQDNIERNRQFILEFANSNVKAQIIDITTELMTKVRI
jgi:chromosome partitioning protein